MTWNGFVVMVCGCNLVLNFMLVFEYHKWEKKLGLCKAVIDVDDIGMWLKKIKAGGKKDLCCCMGYEGVNINWELTENEDHILA